MRILSNFSFLLVLAVQASAQTSIPSPFQAGEFEYIMNAVVNRCGGIENAETMRGMNMLMKQDINAYERGYRYAKKKHSMALARADKNEQQTTIFCKNAEKVYGPDGTGNWEPK